MSKSAFWMVWNPNGGRPTVCHGTLSAAQDEAERLARKHRGQTFVVLQSVCEVSVSDVQRIPHVDVEKIPF